MKYAVVAMLLLAAGCSTTTQDRPIPGSLTYGGKVIHSPYKPGTVIKHTFLGEFGYREFERYVVQPDGTLKLASRITSKDFLWN
ncbi:hypothetical protein FHT87_004776 [Rhizobium sp. BK316]|uniref:hypothetical protein n=1 Tax=Rhizobium sp. BK316 TaxID=2587053 RepID=UPI00161FA3F1|nr:hypothetical protein [Rhizobium sp. BK316]MBB3410829.1 hypothetical protein [Rhizobium sp. BK316]